MTSDIIISNVTESSVFAHWQPVEGATHYQLILKNSDRAEVKVESDNRLLCNKHVSLKLEVLLLYRRVEAKHSSKYKFICDNFNLEISNPWMSYPEFRMNALLLWNVIFRMKNWPRLLSSSETWKAQANIFSRWKLAIMSPTVLAEKRWCTQVSTFCYEALQNIRLTIT